MLLKTVEGMVGSKTAGKEAAARMGYPDAIARPMGSRRYDDAFWKSLFAGSSRRSKEENIKELGF